MTNKEIAQVFKNVAVAYTIKNEKKNFFKILAYQKAADTIEHATLEVKDLWEDGKLDSLPGIGASIASHLDEFFKTGRVKHFEEVFKGLPEAIFPLLAVSGFGSKKAYKMVTELHLKSQETVIEDLMKACKEGKVAKIPGFGEKSQEDILKRLSEYKKGKAKKIRMVLPEADAIARRVMSYLLFSKKVKRVDSLGSLRREVSTIGDIDIAVATDEPKEVIAHFLKFPRIERVIEKGPRGASIIISGGKQVDLRVQSLRSYGSLLQYFTGSKNHNIHLREEAQRKGFSLSEYGIKDNRTGKLVHFKEEKDFYRVLEMDWIPPELREDGGEIKRAQEHNLPKLIKLDDIRGDLHLHSDIEIEPSHDPGKDSMEKIIEKAEELNYEYIGFAEHNPSISRHKEEEIISIIKRRNEVIDKLNYSRKHKVFIFKLLEVDIRPNGRLALKDQAVNLLDGVIASIHSSFNQSKQTMTERITSVIENPSVKIIGHPTGRLLGKREGYEVDWETIFEKCLKFDKALEINAWPDRLDLPDTLVREAIKAGVKLLINTDAHQVGELMLMEYGVSVARRGWAEKNDILNTLPYNKIREWLS